MKNDKQREREPNTYSIKQWEGFEPKHEIVMEMDSNNSTRIFPMVEMENGKLQGVYYEDNRPATKKTHMVCLEHGNELSAPVAKLFNYSQLEFIGGVSGFSVFRVLRTSEALGKMHGMF
jgi:hypothetical protein